MLKSHDKSFKVWKKENGAHDYTSAVLHEIFRVGVDEPVFATEQIKLAEAALKFLNDLTRSVEETEKLVAGFHMAAVRNFIGAKSRSIDLPHLTEEPPEGWGIKY